MALRLKANGITRVHPLEGGLAGWMTLQYPVTPVQVPAAAARASSDAPAAPSAQSGPD